MLELIKIANPNKLPVISNIGVSGSVSIIRLKDEESQKEDGETNLQPHVLNER